MRTVEEIRTEEEMKTLLEESSARPVVLFKDAPTCGISQVAKEAWESWAESVPDGILLARCDVVGARPAARGFTAWLDMAHQSPQVLFLRHGRCVAHASHYSITVD